MTRKHQQSHPILESRDDPFAESPATLEAVLRSNRDLVTRVQALERALTSSDPPPNMRGVDVRATRQGLRIRGSPTVVALIVIALAIVGSVSYLIVQRGPVGTTKIQR